MTRNPIGPAGRGERKQATVSRARGRAGFRRVEDTLEAANLVVQRVDTENDVGRDAFVEMTDGTDVTGAVISIQVKSGNSFYHQTQWVIPCSGADLTLWRDSTIPVFGIVHDPNDDALRWIDLSYAATLEADTYLSPLISGPYGKPSIVVPHGNRLDLDIQPFLIEARRALMRRGGSHVTALLSRDVATVIAGIVDTFAIGRSDSGAFLLLASLFSRLPEETRHIAVETLAMATSHPDVFWSRDNWIPTHIKVDLHDKLQWTDIDVIALLSEIDDEGIQRGSIGQSVFHVLDMDKGSASKIYSVALTRSAPERVRFWATAILLYLAGENASAELNRLLAAEEARESQDFLFPIRPRLGKVDGFDQLVEMVEAWGCVELF